MNTFPSPSFLLTHPSLSLVSRREPFRVGPTVFGTEINLYRISTEDHVSNGESPLKTEILFTEPRIRDRYELTMST